MATNTNTDEVQLGEAPRGLPKSGRFWKNTQTKRFSSVTRQGVLSHMSKPFAVKQEQRVRQAQIKAIEAQMRDATKQAILEKKARREENQRRRMENEFKNSSYQSLNAEKIKGMSKKQLRQVKKTVMNKNGQVELVGLYGQASTPAARKGRK